jgi:hypothetical protein
VAGFVAHYNTVCLHGAIGYITPAEFLLAAVPRSGRRATLGWRPAREARRAHRAAAREAPIQIAQLE